MLLASVLRMNLSPWTGEATMSGDVRASLSLPKAASFSTEHVNFESVSQIMCKAANPSMNFL